MIVSIDIETTGLDSETCQILEIAAIVETDATMPIKELPFFHCLVRHNIYSGDAYALQMNTDIFRELSNVTPCDLPILSLHKVNVEFTTFLQKYRNGDDKLLPLGKNFASFDKQFLKKLPTVCSELDYRTLDLGNLFFDPRVDKSLPSLSTCFVRAGMTGELVVQHRAYEDASITLQMYRFWRD